MKLLHHFIFTKNLSILYRKTAKNNSNKKTLLGITTQCKLRLGSKAYTLQQLQLSSPMLPESRQCRHKFSTLVHHERTNHNQQQTPEVHLKQKKTGCWRCTVNCPYFLQQELSVSRAGSSAHLATTNQQT